MRGGVLRQVPALRMAADDDLPASVGDDVVEVGGGAPLGGHGVLEGHVEVLLPPDQARVRAPEGHVGEVGAQRERHGAELLLLVDTGLRRVGEDPHVAEPGVRRHRREQPVPVLGLEDVGEVAVVVLRARQVADAHARAPGADSRHGGQVEVGGGGQDQGVDLAQWLCVQARQVRARVVDDGAHAPPSASCVNRRGPRAAAGGGASGGPRTARLKRRALVLDVT